jgi:hypothetical protein
MFALDSIPAVFAVTTDPFIVFSSNLFAILGLRSLYFLLAGLLDRFVYLKLGLSALLVFAGVKILLGIVHVEIPIAASLGIIVLILATAIVASFISTHPRRDEMRQPLLRIATGTGLGVLATLLFMGMAAARDAGALWLVADAVILAVAAVVVGAGFLALRAAKARSPLVRAWVTAGTALLLLAAVLVALD